MLMGHATGMCMEIPSQQRSFGFDHLKGFSSDDRNIRIFPAAKFQTIISRSESDDVVLRGNRGLVEKKRRQVALAKSKAESALLATCSVSGDECPKQHSLSTPRKASEKAMKQMNIIPLNESKTLDDSDADTEFVLVE
ncbi:hypothetical protein PoB_003305600 [Plakobranchus ocellatus]|uniref:Uncharacterized protein n=1 Tax=Plakobranchus ocellatus TaxID=259542 RepID=A0AAV4A5P7_9GAST|nr:hypothetical protein PoB_003305600 [Plakobranchus ocellatus]